MDKEELIQLQNDTNDILWGDIPNFNEPINYYDLGCVEARIWSNQEGNEGYTVYIEEAGTDCYEFKMWIKEKLVGMGWQFPEIEVVTRW